MPRSYGKGQPSQNNNSSGAARDVEPNVLDLLRTAARRAAPPLHDPVQPPPQQQQQQQQQYPYQQPYPTYQQQQPQQYQQPQRAAMPAPRTAAPAGAAPLPPPLPIAAATAAVRPQGYVCTGCGRVMPSVDELASHMEAARHGKWFDCPVPRCGWSFVTQKCLSDHVARTHCGTGPEPQQQQQQLQVQQQQPPPQQYRQQQQPAYQVNYQPAARSAPYPATGQQQQQPRQHQQQGSAPSSFAQMAARAAAKPGGFRPADRNYGQQVQKAQLQEGASLNGDSKKTYDAIVKAFIEDDTRGELQFPATLTAQERHHVHKLCMHYQLDHQSTGAGATRQLKIWKPHFVASPTSGQQGDGDSSAASPTVRAFDGFTGCQPLNDEYLADHIAEVETLVKEPSRHMHATMTATLAHAAAVEARRMQQRERVRSHPGPWFSGKPQPADAALRAKSASLQEFRHRLPTYAMKDAIVEAVRRNVVTVLSGDTGCGKTTQLPQLLYDAGIGRDLPGGGMILCTQPRRVSAISVAQRVAEERGERCGDSVGYSIRFENVASSNTRILYLTTGILLRRLHSDPQLAGVSVVVVDEVHERDVDTDFALLLLRDLVRSKKTKIRLVVMSATIQVEKLVDYFREPAPAPAPPLIAVPGALFEVKEYWLDEALSWLGADPTSVPAMAAAIANASKAAKGAVAASPAHSSSYDNLKEEALAKLDKDATETTVPIEVIAGIIEMYHKQAPRSNAVLVFLPGWAAIDKVMRSLQQKGTLTREMSILPLHSTLTTAEQQRVFYPAPKNMRKVVLATNIAETSITIDDIVLVIDSCLHKGTSYDAAGNTSSLTSQLIAKANGKQRRGRAGRVQAGVCVHLLPKQTYDALPDFLPPEMQRTALEEICLQVKAIVDHESCVSVLGKAMDPPPAASVRHAVEQLNAVGALDSKERLTALGRTLAAMPLHPTLGKMLLLGAALGVFDPLCTLAAALSGKGCFLKPLPHQLTEARAAQRQFDKGKASDHFAVLELYTQWAKAPRRNDFAYSHWADHLSLLQVDRMRTQLSRLLRQSGYLKTAQPGWESRYATNEALVRFALAHSLSPRIAVMERDARNRHNNLFCWDNKPATLHPSSVLSRVKLREVNGTEFFAYFDRMRMESQLLVFDASAISRTTAVLAAKTLDVLDTVSIDEATRIDDRKFIGWDNYSQREGAEVDAASTIVMDGGKKRFTVSDRLANALMAVHDLVNFNFSVSLQRMDVQAVADDVVCALAAALGAPARRIDPSTLLSNGGEGADAPGVRVGPGASAMVPNARSDSDTDDDAAPEIDHGTDDEADDGAAGSAAGQQQDGTTTATAGTLTEAEADVLVRAFGDLSWITRRTRPQAASSSGAAASTAQTAQQLRAAAPESAGPVSPTSDSAATTTIATPPVASPLYVDPGAVPASSSNAADDDDDDDEGDEIIAAAF